MMLDKLVLLVSTVAFGFSADTGSDFGVVDTASDFGVADTGSDFGVVVRMSENGDGTTLIGVASIDGKDPSRR